MSRLDKVSLIVLFVLIYLILGILWGTIYTGTRDKYLGNEWKQFEPIWWQNQKLRQKNENS